MDQRQACGLLDARTLLRLGLVFFAVILAIRLAVVGVPAEAWQATPSPVSSPGLQITASGSACEVEGQISLDSAPFFGVTFRNEAAEPHQVQFVALQPGIPAAELTGEVVQNAVAPDPGTDSVVQTFMGGSGAIQTGGAEEIVLELPSSNGERGEVAALCSIPGQEDQAIVQAIDVPDPDGSAAEPLDADVTVTLTDDAIDMPIMIEGGTQIWQVTNAGTRPHDLVLVALLPSVTQANIQEHMQENNGGLPANVAAGGMRVLSPGATGWIRFDLPPGNYLALCDIDQTSRAFVVAE